MTERPTLVGLTPDELEAIAVAMGVVVDVARLTKRDDLMETWSVLRELLERARKVDGQRQWEYFHGLLGGK